MSRHTPYSFRSRNHLKKHHQSCLVSPNKFWLRDTNAHFYITMNVYMFKLCSTYWYHYHAVTLFCMNHNPPHTPLYRMPQNCISLMTQCMQHSMSCSVSFTAQWRTLWLYMYYIFSPYFFVVVRFEKIGNSLPHSLLSFQYLRVVHLRQWGLQNKKKQGEYISDIEVHACVPN